MNSEFMHGEGLDLVTSAMPESGDRAGEGVAHESGVKRRGGNPGRTGVTCHARMILILALKL